mmetsp:Transcript_43979/g.104093  ORF Transcript_43979/g.104093 Transcript_43979/m.104093 type:complete len:1491 (+) Transcript_43979:153-4625(+)
MRPVSEMAAVKRANFLSAAFLALLCVSACAFVSAKCQLPRESVFETEGAGPQYPSLTCTLLALALLATNVLGLSAIMPKSGPMAQNAFVIAILVGLMIPNTTALGSLSSVPPRPAYKVQKLQNEGPSPSSSLSLARLVPRLSLRGGGEDVFHEHSFVMRPGVTFQTQAKKMDDGTIEAKFFLKSPDVKGVTLHWGVSMNSDDEWVTPNKAGCESIVPSNSALYKDRAIRTPLKKTNDGLELTMRIPGDVKPKMPIGIRFVLWEPSSDMWYPGGSGGNFFVPLEKREKKRRPPPLQRSPSFTGAVDVESMEQKMQYRDERPGGVELSADLGHLMWNAAQREKAWVDGRKETKGMRLQRSPSFESAVKIMESVKAQKEKDDKEAQAFWQNEGGRLYYMPFNYQAERGRRKGTVKVAVTKEKKVKITVVPEKSDKGPGPLLLHWGVGTKNPWDWEKVDSKTLAAMNAGEKGQIKLKREAELQVLEFEFQDTPPMGMTFVLKDEDKGEWYKAEGKDFCVPITEAGRSKMEEKPKSDGAKSAGHSIVRTMSGTEIMAPDGASIAKEIFDGESKASVTLMHRYNHACHLIEKSPPGPDGRDAIIMIFCWLRFSQIRQLSWQRHYNTKPRELSAASERLNKLIAWRWKNASAREKEIYRMMLGCIGRGGSGGDGQAIRDEILHIMHRHKLPESKGTFMEEWHQKLHNNSTPDDIIICQAYLAFLHSNGDQGVFWRVLQENGLDRDRLRGYERAIHTDPQFFGDKKDGLIHDFNNYLRILKNVHAGADLEKCVEVCKNFLDGHINVLLESILRERGCGEDRVLAVVDSITEVRQLVSTRMTAEGDIVKLRDLLYLDLGLEAQMRLLAERAFGTFEKLNLESLTRGLTLWIAFAAENLVYSSSPGSGKLAPPGDLAEDANEIKACLRDWAQLVEDAHKGVGKTWMPKAMAVVDRMRRALGGIVDMISGSMQHKAEYLGHGLAMVTPEKIPEKWTITLFSEELVRGGGCSFVLSSFLRKLDKALRAQGGGSMWQVISAGKPGANGWVVQVPDLMSVQECVYDRPTVLLANSLSGEEEVPPGVVGVITPEAPDVLAHISVRARNLRVFFAGCFDPDEFDKLSDLVGKHVSCSQTGDKVQVVETEPDKDGNDGLAKVTSGLAALNLKLPPPAKFTKWCLPESQIGIEHKPKLFGAKSTNIVQVRKTLPEWVLTPKSAVVPFGVFEKVLEASENKDVAAEYKKLVEKELPASKEPLHVLQRLKAQILRLLAPPDLEKSIKASLVESGIIIQGELEGADWEEAFTALKGVWASKWNDRAYFSCKKANIGAEHVQMAVLVQRLVEADYAFVIHTKNPFKEDSGEMYAEVVVGLGETLVGNYPGRALGFAMNKDGSGDPQVQSMPSKSVGLFGGGLIFRSDSNGEDLPGFAGAGLYDSIPMVKNEHRTLMYHKEPLVVDRELSDKVMRGVCKVAADVEKAMDGVAQDIEGCYKDGKFYVVQTRPQV